MAKGQKNRPSHMETEHYKDIEISWAEEKGCVTLKIGAEGAVSRPQPRTPLATVR